MGWGWGWLLVKAKGVVSEQERDLPRPWGASQTQEENPGEGRQNLGDGEQRMGVTWSF